MSVNDALRKAREFISAQSGVIAPLPISEEELNPSPQDDLSVQAIPLESTASCIQVNYEFPADSKFTEFAFFEDGKQRTVQIGFIPTDIGETKILIPVHFFVVAAAVLERKEGVLKVWNSPEIERGILIEKSLVPNQNILSQCNYSGHIDRGVMMRV